MNIDEKIKQELQADAANIEKNLTHDTGIFDMLAQAFKGSLGRWMILVAFVGTAMTLLMFWAGYQFFFIEGSEMHKLHWGVVLLLATMMQIALKMWSFMEMNRQSVLRETKRVELAVEHLMNKFESLEK